MSPATLNAMPDVIDAGTTIKYQRTYGDFPANGGWTATLHIAGAVKLSIAATTSGASFLYTISATNSANLEPGNYEWREVVTKSGEVYVADAGVVEVMPNVAAAAAGDLQTHAEKMLAAIEAKLEGRIENDAETYQVINRMVQHIPFDKLQAARERYRAMVWQEKHPGEFGPPIRAAFTGTESEI